MNFQYIMTVHTITPSGAMGNNFRIEAPDNQHDWEVDKFSATTDTYNRIHAVCILWKRSTK